MSCDNNRWIACRDGWFLPNKVLGRVFRGKFLAALQDVCTSGQLKLYGPLEALNTDPGFRKWRGTLPGPAWNVYIEPPPTTAQSDPDHLLKYLARYVAGTAISNHRLVALHNGEVTFTVKNRDTQQRELRTLPAVEFLSRFVTHILPPGLHRIRFCGLWANRNRDERLNHCRDLIAASNTSVAEASSLPPHREHSSSMPEAAPDESNEKCEHCGSSRIEISFTRPSEGLYAMSFRLFGHLMGGQRAPAAHDTS